MFLLTIIHTRILKLRLSLGSGRAMVFYLGRLGSNPRTDLGFFLFGITVNLFLLGAGLFLIMCNRTMPKLILEQGSLASKIKFQNKKLREILIDWSFSSSNFYFLKILLLWSEIKAEATQTECQFFLPGLSWAPVRFCLLNFIQSWMEHLGAHAITVRSSNNWLF